MRNLKDKGLKRGSTVSSDKQNITRLLKERTSSFSIRILEKNDKNISNSQTTKCGSSNQTFPPLSSIKPEKVAQHQRKPSLVIKQSKPSLCIQKNYIRKISKNKQIIQKEINMSTLIQNLLKILENNFILSQKQSNTLIIKKQDLSKLLQKCLFYRSSFCLPQFLQNSQQFDSSLCAIWQQIEEQKKKDKKSKLNIQQTLYDNYTSKDFSHNVHCHKQQISLLLQRQSEIKSKIEYLELQLKKLLASKQFIFQIVDQKQKNIENLEEKIKLAQSNIASLQEATIKKQEYLCRMQKEQDQLFNFVNNQNKNKHVKQASEDYKLIEADIYDYAAYLQANQLASNINYEHLPIICHTHDLDQRLAAFNKMLIQDQDISIKQKGRKLRDFLLEIVEKYRKKDIEIQKLMDFKTKCIMTFVENMKKWLSNWELKQEYLKNLRMEHIYNHNKILGIFEQLDLLEMCTKCRMQMHPKKKRLQELYMKTDENYKMGNSFY